MRSNLFDNSLSGQLMYSGQNGRRITPCFNLGKLRLNGVTSRPDLFIFAVVFEGNPHLGMVSKDLSILELHIQLLNLSNAQILQRL